MNAIYFDMDGTICDLERSFVDRSGIPVSSFSAMTKEEKEMIDLVDIKRFRIGNNKFQIAKF